MLDSAPRLQLQITPLNSPNPHCLDKFLAHVGGGASPAVGAGDTEYGAALDLIEILIDSITDSRALSCWAEVDCPDLYVTAVIESLTNSEDVCNLIDCLGEDSDKQPFMIEAITHLETIDPQAAAVRRSWF